MSIILPLYIYPSAGAWNPLYAAATAHRNIEFTVVVNPCSGPCMGSLPDQVYLNEIPKLRSYPNIRTLGYVATQYAYKDIEAVLAEIDVYSKWPRSTNNTEMRVDGIFFDETPSAFTADTYGYLKRASQAVRNGTTFKDRFVAHNPGHFPATILSSESVLRESYLNLTDMTVVLEESFNKWIDRAVMDPLQEHKINRSKLAMILHSLPNLSTQVLEFIVGQVEETAGWLFLTNVTQPNEYYHSFSGMFADLVRAVDGPRWGKPRRRLAHRPVSDY